MTPMNRGITFTKSWSDDDVVELEIAAFDHASAFRCQVYASHACLALAIKDLEAFKHQVYGGIYDLRLGAHGPEYANGAFHARLHFSQKAHGQIFMTIAMETAWFEFTVTKVANRCVTHLVSEPSLLDNFIRELAMLHDGNASEAFLQIV